jgi:hypothetical protein
MRNMYTDFITESPHFRAFCDHDLPELEQMIFTLYQEDAHGETMSRQKIRRTVQELLKYPEKGAITVFCIDDAIVRICHRYLLLEQ